MATEQGAKAVENGVQRSKETGESILTLTSSFSDTAQIATQIAASSHQQLIGMEQATIAMENIKQASGQNVESAKQLETAAHNIASLGSKLKQLVERYKLARDEEQRA
jgi:methyl-accepting chemotaxis protein